MGTETCKIAKSAHYGAVTPSLEISYLSSCEYQQALEKLKGKRVLVYVHGLQTNHTNLLISTNAINKNLLELKEEFSYLSKIKQLFYRFLGYSEQDIHGRTLPYDAVIGYSWPSYYSPTHYHLAKEHALKLAPRFSKEIDRISKVASKVDLMAHSMGNLLVLEALSHSPLEAKIKDFYSLAAAVPKASLDDPDGYLKAIENCDRMYIFHSKYDEALGWPFYIAEAAAHALGLLGPSEKMKAHPKIQVVDTSEYIKGHSEYLYSSRFYQHLSDIQS